MCGRFYLDSDRETIEQSFEVDLNHFDLKTSYNIAPSQSILTITQDMHSRQAQIMRWGLVPTWSKQLNTHYSMINARAESIHLKPAYKRPFIHSRCLIPASGFYEWKKVSGGKQPYCITSADPGLIAFAGIWDSWKGPDGDILSCSIVTTRANSVVREIHERMPVMLTDSSINDWLDPDNQDIDDLQQILNSGSPPLLDIWPISNAVNVAKNNSPDLLKPF